MDQSSIPSTSSGINNNNNNQEDQAVLDTIVASISNININQADPVDPVNQNSQTDNDDDDANVVKQLEPLVQYIEDLPSNKTNNNSVMNIIDSICDHIGYQLLNRDVIGAGSFGKVFQIVKKQNSSKKLVIKYIRERHEQSIGEVESRHMKALMGHANLVQLVGVFLSCDIPVSFIVMDSYDIDLSDYLNERGGDGGTRCGEFGLRSRQLGMLVSGIGDAIRYMHSRNIVHHDIKLENIMLRLSGPLPPAAHEADFWRHGRCCPYQPNPLTIVHCALIDFGCAVQYTNVGGGSGNGIIRNKRTYLLKKAFNGSPTYMPAEVLTNHYNQDDPQMMHYVNPFLHDTFSFGVTLAYSLLCNEHCTKPTFKLGSILIRKLVQKFSSNPIQIGSKSSPLLPSPPAVLPSPLSSSTILASTSSFATEAAATATRFAATMMANKDDADDEKVQKKLQSIISLLEVDSKRSLIEEEMIELWKN